MVPKFEVQIRRILSWFEEIFLTLDIKKRVPMTSAPQARKFLRFCLKIIDFIKKMNEKPAQIPNIFSAPSAPDPP